MSRSISRVLFLNQINGLRDGHLSSIYVTINIKQSTRSSKDANNILESFWSCTGWGLHIFWISSNYCSLLHYYFTLTLRRYFFCCTFHSLKNFSPLESILFCSARTFLSKIITTSLEQPSDRLKHLNLL